jgi:hypothetical protein
MSDYHEQLLGMARPHLPGSAMARAASMWYILSHTPATPL